MKTKALTSIMIAAAAAFTFSSCKKEADMSLGLKMRTTSNPVVRIGANNTIQWTSGNVTIREIVFDGDKKRGDDVSITHEQISTIDLVTGTASPAIEITIPAGKYNSVNLGIEIQDETNDPSVLCEGIYTDANGIQTPIRFEFNSGEVFEANASEHDFDKKSSPIAEIDFSPAVWFSGITAAQLDAADRVGGVILINESYNSDLFTIVADKMDNATQAYFK